VETTTDKSINISCLNEKIAELDALLESVKEHMSDFKNDLEVYEYVVQAQDALFRLTQVMRGCKIIEFAAPWIEPSELEEKRRVREDHEF
jgi:hypothetical protein